MAWGGSRPGAGRKPRPTNKPTRAATKVPDRAAISTERKVLAISESILHEIGSFGGSRYKPTRENAPHLNPFKIAEHPPGAMPTKDLQMAMDTSLSWAQTQWAGGTLANVAAEGLLFLGYPYLAELSQRPEYRTISETIATEMTRKWIKLAASSEKDDKNLKIQQLTEYLDDLGVRDAFTDLATQDGFYGRSHLFLDDGIGDPTELKTSIGDGKNQATKAKIKKGWLKAVRTIEAVWVYPTTYNAQNPLMPDWYNPQVWFVMGQEIHRTRLLTFIGRPVSDLLKPAYSFGGLSLSQIAKPYVDIWLKTRESVGELIHAFSVMVLGTDMQSMLQPGGASPLLIRAALFNALRDNQGLMMINKDTEEFKNVSASLAGLHELQAQSQEHMMSVSRIPAVKFTGNQPSGLNASSEGEIRAFYDTIAAYQNKFFRPNLTTVIDIAQLSLWGKVDPDITFEFEPLWELSEKEKAEKRKADAEAGQVHIDTGVITPAEERARIATDPTGVYHGLDPDEIPNLLEEEEEGLQPQGGRPLEAAQEKADEEVGVEPNKKDDNGNTRQQE